MADSINLGRAIVFLQGSTIKLKEIPFPFRMIAGTEFHFIDWRMKRKNSL